MQEKMINCLLVIFPYNTNQKWLCFTYKGYLPLRFTMNNFPNKDLNLLWRLRLPNCSSTKNQSLILHVGLDNEISHQTSHYWIKANLSQPCSHSDLNLQRISKKKNQQIQVPNHAKLEIELDTNEEPRWLYEYTLLDTFY